jgi:hypothetical protein
MKLEIIKCLLLCAPPLETILLGNLSKWLGNFAIPADELAVVTGKA